MEYYCYILTDPSRNNEPIYVGKGKGSRAWSHLNRQDMHPLTYRISHMKKKNAIPNVSIYGELDEEFALFLEEELICKFGRKDLGKGSLLNLTDGGDGKSGHVVSLETKKLMSLVRTGEIRSNETKTNISKAKRGQRYSDEARKNMSIGQTGRIHSEERNKKISTKLMGHKCSEETRNKISEKVKNSCTGEKNGMFGKTHSTEAKQKMRAARIKYFEKKRLAKEEK